MRKKGIFVLLFLVVVISLAWAQTGPSGSGKSGSTQQVAVGASCYDPYQCFNSTIGCLSLIVLVIGLVYAGKQLKSLHKIHADNHEWNRKKAAQDAVFKIAELAEECKKLNEKTKYVNTHQPISVDRITQIFKDDPELQVICHSLLNYYEALARGVSNAIYDEATIKTARRGAMISTHRVFSAYIDHRRKHHPEAYTQFEALVRRWQHQDTHITTSDLIGEKKN